MKPIAYDKKQLFKDKPSLPTYYIEYKIDYNIKVSPSNIIA